MGIIDPINVQALEVYILNEDWEKATEVAFQIWVQCTQNRNKVSPPDPQIEECW